MNNYYKYLPVSADDIDWGLQILNAGYYECGANSGYPDNKHPSHHNFNWDKGRVLQEYQMVYVCGGGGIYNSKHTGDIAIEPGSIIVIFPGEAHRYRPDAKTGWKEYWVGFNGPIINNLISKDFFSPDNPIIKIGYSETILNLYMQIIDATRNERPGYQPLVSGATMYILGQLHTYSKQNSLDIDDEEKIVNHARMIIRSSIESDISPQHIADELQISYSRFRKIFKEYTGIAPVQYQIQLKIERAKELLAVEKKSIKEISYELNFESCNYFSALFKEKTGFSPVEFRRSMAS